ncbi:hypothetical protein ABT084_12985 [Streptomyces sp. NPDC002138]|uniref:hypothetical protein n=1 Tax=Streptomyces sp. NPDC002138 TaxID=3154410 RepID=UPI00333163BF
MYLIHASLRAPASGTPLPPHAGELVRTFADSEVPVEHVSTHPHALPGPVLGVYLLADSLEQAERRTETLCRRAFEKVPALRGWTVGRVGVPMVTAYYEGLLLAGSGPAGRNGPGPVPSS